MEILQIIEQWFLNSRQRIITLISTNFSIITHFATFYCLLFHLAFFTFLNHLRTWCRHGRVLKGVIKPLKPKCNLSVIENLSFWARAKSQQSTANSFPPVSWDHLLTAQLADEMSIQLSTLDNRLYQSIFSFVLITSVWLHTFTIITIQ